MLGDPFLDLDLALTGAVEGELQRGALVGRSVDVDVRAAERRCDEASGEDDGFEHWSTSCFVHEDMLQPRCSDLRAGSSPTPRPDTASLKLSGVNIGTLRPTACG